MKKGFLFLFGMIFLFVVNSSVYALENQEDLLKLMKEDPNFLDANYVDYYEDINNLIENHGYVVLLNDSNKLGLEIMKKYDLFVLRHYESFNTMIVLGSDEAVQKLKQEKAVLLIEQPKISNSNKVFSTELKVQKNIYLTNDETVSDFEDTANTNHNQLINMDLLFHSLYRYTDNDRVLCNL